MGFLANLGAKVTVRKKEDGELFVTDQGNYILDAYFGPIKEPGPLAFKLSRRAGVVEHGLFLGLATDVIVAGKWGVEHLIRDF
jgi:ribose 5-phosphate isomerase A